MIIWAHRWKSLLQHWAMPEQHVLRQWQQILPRRRHCYHQSVNWKSWQKVIDKVLFLIIQNVRLVFLFAENNSEQQQSITISIELNGVAYQGTLYATTLTANKEWPQMYAFQFDIFFFNFSFRILLRFVSFLLFLSFSLYWPYLMQKRFSFSFLLFFLCIKINRVFRVANETIC